MDNVFNLNRDNEVRVVNGLKDDTTTSEPGKRVDTKNNALKEL